MKNVKLQGQDLKGVKVDDINDAAEFLLDNLSDMYKASKDGDLAGKMVMTLLMNNLFKDILPGEKDFGNLKLGGDSASKLYYDIGSRMMLASAKLSKLELHETKDTIKKHCEKLFEIYEEMLGFFTKISQEIELW